VVPVAITVVIFLNDYSVPIPVFVAITDNRTVVVSIAVPIMSSADCYANRPDTNSNLLRARRHSSANARHSGNHQSVFHYVLLHCETKLSKQQDCHWFRHRVKISQVFLGTILKVRKLPHHVNHCHAAADFPAATLKNVCLVRGFLSYFFIVSPQKSVR
jgi:hypothetical protein